MTICRRIPTLSAWHFPNTPRRFPDDFPTTTLSAWHSPNTPRRFPTFSQRFPEDVLIFRRPPIDFQIISRFPYDSQRLFKYLKDFRAGSKISPDYPAPPDISIWFPENFRIHRRFTDDSRKILRRFPGYSRMIS